MCPLQARGSGRPIVEFKFSLKAWDLWDKCCKSWSEAGSLRTWSLYVQGQEKIDVSDQPGNTWVHPSSQYRQALSRLDDASPHWGGPLAFLSSPIQMLTSSGSSLSKTPQNNVLPAVCEPLISIKLTHKINYHRERRKQGHQNLMQTV